MRRFTSPIEEESGVRPGSCDASARILKSRRSTRTRHTLSPEAPGDGGAGEAIRALEASGPEVRVELADVTSETAMREVLERIASSLPPLRGVINASGVIAGGAVVPEQGWDAFANVLDVKVAGSWILHALTRDMPLDFFVGFSSASSLLRSPGQAS